LAQGPGSTPTTRGAEDADGAPRPDETERAWLRTYHFLEPNVTRRDFAHRTARAELARKQRRDGIISAYAAFAGALIGSSKDAELADTLARHDFLRRSSTDRRCGDALVEGAIGPPSVPFPGQPGARA
jgi:hypothetical protein